MSSRFGNHNLSLVGFSFIFITLGSLLYLIHITHNTLEETRERLKFSDEKLQRITAQYGSLSDYKMRLEEAFLSMKSGKAAVVQNDLTARDELDQLRDLCTKQMDALQEELGACQRKVANGMHPSAASSNRHVGKYFVGPPGGGSGGIFSQNPAPPEDKLSPSMTITPINSNPSPQPVSGNPNEDLAGNVLI